VLDPFSGGATTLVEAQALGRIGIGLDVNELSCFISAAKTTVLSDHDIAALTSWTHAMVSNLNLRVKARRPKTWIENGYQRNINGVRTWRIRKALELALGRIDLLDHARQKRFARALLLRTGQWALDCRTNVPTLEEFRNQLLINLEAMLKGAKEYSALIRNRDPIDRPGGPIILHRSAEALETDPRIRRHGPPRLVLTSPPYPGVHVLYHRWQIFGRKETPAPYWIANVLDGNGLSYYTFGDRKAPELRKYFETAQSAFGSIAKVADDQTLIVQMVAFSDASWQLPEYLERMQSAGLREVFLPNHERRRLWRKIPHRKWYTEKLENDGTSREVVLFHRRD